MILHLKPRTKRDKFETVVITSCHELLFWYTSCCELKMEENAGKHLEKTNCSEVSENKDEV